MPDTSMNENIRSRKVCLFAHFSQSQSLSASVLHYLAQLVQCGLSVHVALSGMERLDGPDREILDELGIAAYPRPNEGLDFGAWQYLMRTGCADEADHVFLANDSVFGPIRDLAPIVATMQSRGLDVWGMIESHEISWHLQSWFICLTRAALARPAIARVFGMPFTQMDKAEIILHGEIGLGTAIRTEALSWGACLPDRRRGLRKLIAANPMHVDWVSVLACGQVPFIKVELLRDNPARIPWFGLWPEMLRRHGDFPEAWIHARITPAEASRTTSSLRMRLLYVLLSRDRLQALRSVIAPS